MSARSASPSDPNEPNAVTPFSKPAGLTPALAAVALTNVASIRCAAAATSASRINCSAAGVESRSNSMLATASAATLSGVSETVEKSALLAGIPFDSPTQ